MLSQVTERHTILFLRWHTGRAPHSDRKPPFKLGWFFVRMDKNMKTILVDAINMLVIPDKGIFVEMEKLLNSFSNRKIILTNANTQQMMEFGLDDMPCEVFTLKRNTEKADPAYYEKMLQHFALEKDDVIYFEHDENAVKSAQSVGIKTYRYDNDKKDLVALKKFLMENFK